jgi:hypothetical protein
LAGCYSGDGSLTDNGPLAATDRYVLDLGVVDLSKGGERAFRLAGLLSTEFAIGLEILRTDGGRILGADGEIDKSIRTVVRLRLENERQQIVFDHSAPLSEWEWGVARTQEEKAFVYLRGAVTFVPVRQGVTSYTPMGVGPDGGWGTYFSPRDAATYTLRFQALSPRASNWPSSVRLIAKGGGWK